MPGLKKLALAVIVILVSGQLSFARPNQPIDRSGLSSLLDGHEIINVVDDFLAFWDLAKDLNSKRQQRLWRRMVERPHKDYFERAVYRHADPEQRRLMLEEFLLRVPERIEGIRKFNLEAKYNLVRALVYFKSRFPEYRQQKDIYIGLSMFSFDGSVRPVQNEEGIPDTLCLGADVLADYSEKQLLVALSHEFFHLYHFGFLFQQPSLDEIRTAHMPLMIEGMAVAGAEAVYPFQPGELYLHFSSSEFAAQEEDLVVSSQRYLGIIADDAPPDLYEQWFTNSPTGDVPLRGGYLLGYEVTRRVLAAYTLEQMVRMTPAQLREHAEEQLTAMATDGVLLMSTSN